MPFAAARKSGRSHTQKLPFRGGGGPPASARLRRLVPALYEPVASAYLKGRAAREISRMEELYFTYSTCPAALTKFFVPAYLPAAACVARRIAGAWGPAYLLHIYFATPGLGFAFRPASAAGACGAGVGVGAGFFSSPATASRMACAMASTSLCCRRFLPLSTAASAAVTAEKAPAEPLSRPPACKARAAA